MCAIVSWAGKAKRGQWRVIHRLLTELLIVSEVRGTDAAGFAAVDRHGEIVMDKRPLRSRVFASKSVEWNRLFSPSLLVAHCRAATHGSPHTGDNRNNHPFVGDGVAVVVNGVARNYREIADDHNLALTTECDSEVVLRLVERHDQPASGLRIALHELSGGIAAAVLDARRRVVWIARDEARPAWMLKLAGLEGTFVCSTQDIAVRALRRTFGSSSSGLVEVLMPLAPNVVIAMSSQGKVFTDDEQMPWTKCS